MTIKEALVEICDELIPKEINGVRTKYFIREYNSVIGVRNVEITIMPTDVRTDNIGVTHRYNQDYYFTYEFSCGSLGYGRLLHDMERLLCQYIRNIINYFQGKVIETRVIDFKRRNNNG